MHADGKSTLASVSKWNSVKVNFRRLKQDNFFFLFQVTSSGKLQEDRLLMTSVMTYVCLKLKRHGPEMKHYD